MLRSPLCLSTRTRFILGVALCLSGISVLGLAAPAQHVETFDTTTFRDAALTTAVWDTVTGTLHTQPLSLSNEGLFNGDPDWIEVDGGRLAVGTGGRVELFRLDAPGTVHDGASLATMDWLPRLVTPLCGAYDADWLVLGLEEVITLIPRQLSHSVQVWSVADPTAPVALGSILVSGTPRDLQIRNGWVFVALDTGGVQAIDATDPTALVSGPVTGTPGPALCLDVDGRSLYVGMGAGAGYREYAIGAGGSLSPGSVWESGDDVSDLVCENDLLFAATNTGVWKLRTDGILPNPTPELLATAYPPKRLELDGSWLTVLDGGGRVVLFAPDNADTWTARGWVAPTATPSVDLARYGHLYLLAEPGMGIWFLRTTHPFEPSEDGRESLIPLRSVDNLSSMQADVDRYGQDLYLVGYDSLAGTGLGVRFFSIADPADPVQQGIVSSIGRAYTRVAADPGGAWAIDGTQVRRIRRDFGGLLTEGVSIGLSPDQPPVDVEADDTYLYVLSPGELRIFAMEGLTSTTPPLSTLALSAPADLDQILVWGHLLLLTDSVLGQGLRTVDVSDPAAPVEVSIHPAAGGAWALEGNRLVQAGAGGVRLNEFAPGGSLVFQAAVDFSESGLFEAQAVTIDGPRIYVTDTNGVLAAFDYDGTSALVPAGRFSPAIYGQSSWGLVRSGEHLLRLTTEPTLGGQDYVLETMRVAQRFYDHATTRAVSLPLRVDTSAVRAVRVLPNASGSASYWISNAVGVADPALRVLSGQWTLLDPLVHPGSVAGELRWVVELEEGYAGDPGILNTLTVEWLLDDPVIDGWADVPGDDGGFVQLDFTRSGWEALNNATTGPVDRYVVLRESPFRPAVWESVAAVAATGADVYSTVVPVVTDSIYGGGLTPRSRLIVQGVSSSAGDVHPSASVGAFGLDELAPDPVPGMGVDYAPWNAGNHLGWDPSPAPDIAHYRIYRSTDPILADAVLADSTSALFWDDPDYQQPGVYYGVQAVDDANLAAPITPAGRVTDNAPLPGQSRLVGVWPNPFNPRTTVRFDLATRIDRVRLEVLDARGRHVRTLVRGALPEGAHAILWDGRDDRGRDVGSGVYLLRLAAGRLRQTQKVVLVR